MISSKIITITPEMATSFLERNTKNRPVRKSVVNFLKNSILRGEWLITHQGIAFDEHGTLIDGQHRLLAIVSANTPVEAMVTWGIQRDAFSVIDTITPRKISDLLGISSYCGQAVNLLSSICYYGDIHTRITAKQAHPIASVISPIHDLLSKSTLKGASTAAMRSFVCYKILTEDNGDYAKDLYNQIVAKSFESLPPIGNAFIRFVMKGSYTKGITDGGSIQMNLFGIADFLFSQKNSGKTKITPSSGIDVIRAMNDKLKAFFIDESVSKKYSNHQVSVDQFLEETRP